MKGGACYAKSDSDGNPSSYTVFNQRDTARYQHTCKEGECNDWAELRRAATLAFRRNSL